VDLSIICVWHGVRGSVTAACFAHLGHRIVGVDVSPAKVEMMAGGRSPIIGSSDERTSGRGHRTGRLRATTDSALAVLAIRRFRSSVWVLRACAAEKLDLTYVERVVHEIGVALKQKNSHHLIVLRSTVLPGTTESLVIPRL